MPERSVPGMGGDESSATRPANGVRQWSEFQIGRCGDCGCPVRLVFFIGLERGETFSAHPSHGGQTRTRSQDAECLGPHKSRHKDMERLEMHCQNKQRGMEHEFKLRFFFFCVCGGALTAEGSTKFRNVNEIEENTSPKIVRTPISKALLLMVF